MWMSQVVLLWMSAVGVLKSVDSVHGDYSAYEIKYSGDDSEDETKCSNDEETL